MHWRLLLLPLLLVSSTYGGVSDLSSFCSRNFYGPAGALTLDETRCEMEIRISDSWQNAKSYCESRQFTGRVFNHAADSFHCRFDVQFLCPPGFMMIQSQCYRFQKISYDGRDTFCKSHGAEPATHATNIMLSLLTVDGRKFYEPLSSLWMQRYGQNTASITGKSQSSILTVTRELGNMIRHRATSKAEKKTDSESSVVCRTEVTYTHKALADWCKGQADHFLAQAMLKDDMCIYYTYNLYTVPQPNDIKQANMDLHKRCRMFTDRDYIPADPEFLQTILPIHMKGHPVRIAGMPVSIDRYHEDTVWSMYSSKGYMSTIAFNEWVLSTGPRRQTLSAAGGAYTLGVMKVAGQSKMKYLDVSPHTPLPILCIATLKSETTRIGKCSCPGNSVCDWNNQCVCPPKTEDLHEKFTYLNGDPAPRGRLCFTCTKTSIIVLIPNEYCAPQTKIVETIKKIYKDQQIANNPTRQMAIVLYHLNAPVILDFSQSNDENAFNKALNYKRESFWKNVVNHEGAMRYTEGAGGQALFTHAHIPSSGWKQAVNLLKSIEDNDPNHAKIVFYITHHENNPEVAKWLTGVQLFPYAFRIYKDMNDAINTIRVRHPQTKLIGVSAPTHYDDPDRNTALDWVFGYFDPTMQTATSFDPFNFDKKLHYPRKGTDSTLNSDEAARSVEPFMCQEDTRYPEMNQFKRKRM